MGTAHGSVLAIGLAILASAWPTRAEKGPSYRLVSCYNAILDPAAQFHVRDMEGDGSDEFVIVRANGGSVLLRRWAADARDPNRVLPYENQDIQVNLQPPGVVSPVLGDVTGDGRVDLFVISGSPGQLASGENVSGLIVTCYAPATPLCVLGPFLEGCDRRVENTRGQVNVVATEDVNGDGRRDILLFDYPYATGCEARSLRAYDATSGRELWRFESPTPPGDLIVCEPAPGAAAQPVIVLGAFACGNGFAVEDWDDEECRLTGVSFAGARLWQTRMGGKGTGTRLLLADRDGDGRREPYVSIQGDRDDAGREPRPEVFRLDPESGALTPFRVPEYPHALLAADIDGRPGEEILLVGRDQMLYALHGDFSVAWRYSQDRVRAVLGVVDLDGDSRPELLCDCGDLLRVLDRGGTELVQVGLSGIPPLTRAGSARIGGGNYLFVRQGGQLKILRLERVPGDAPAWLWVLATGLVFTAGASVLRMVRTAACREFEDEFMGLRHGQGAAPFVTVRRLSQLLLSWKHISEQGGVASSPLPELTADFEQRVMPSIRRMARMGPRTGLPRTLWAGLDEDAALVLGQLRDLCAAEESALANRFGRATSAVRGFMERCGRIEERFPLPPSANQVAHQVLELRRAELREAGVVSEVTADGDGSHRVDFPADELRAILDNCVENSLRALKGRPDPRLSIAVRSENRWCLIDVADNGSGLALPKGQWERVFDAGYTTRQVDVGDAGGGFGLSRARQLLSRSGGTIEVAGSSPDAGTTMRIRLRAYRHRRRPYARAVD